MNVSTQADLDKLKKKWLDKKVQVKGTHPWKGTIGVVGSIDLLGGSIEYGIRVYSESGINFYVLNEYELKKVK